MVSDVYQLQENNGIKNISNLIACVDYKLPLVLRGLGILEYSSELSNTVDNKIEIDKGSEQEMEIKANTMWSIHLIAKLLRENNSDIETISVSDYIWLLGKDKNKFNKPHHLTRTIYY
jgi:hypothetical protein